MSLVALLFSTLTFVAVARAATDSTCYYPSGLQNRGRPCNPDAEASSCCGPGFVCLSNGLCTPGKDDRQTYRYKYYRSGCTDSTWNSTACPQYCLETGDSLDSGEGIQSCGSNSYCCNRNYDCCSNSTNIFTLGAAEIIRTIPYSSSTSAASSVPSSPASPYASSESGSKSSGVAIGVGVGVGAAAIVIAILAVFILLRRRRNKRHENKTPLELDPDQTMFRHGDSKDRWDHASDDEIPKVPEMQAESNAHIPRLAQELAPQDRFEMATLPGGETPHKMREQRESEHPGRFFKDEGIYRHEIAG